MMNIPEQLKPLSKKGDKFVKDSALAFASIARGSGKQKSNDETCWNYFNGKIDKDKFKYLTHIGDYILPARFKRVSIQRPPINLLISQQSRRPFVFSVVVMDEQSIAEKFNNRYQAMIKKVEEKILEQKMIFEVEYKRVEQQEAEIRQRLEQEPQSEEEAQQMQALRAQLPEIETALNNLKTEFERRITIGKEDIRKIRDYLTYEYREMKEHLAQKSTEKIRNKYNVKDQSVSYFTDKIVTGKGAYYVDYIEGDKDIIYESVDSMQVYYPSIPGVKYIQDGPWVVLEDYISFSMVLDQYGGSKALDDDVIKELEYFKDYSAGDEIGATGANVYTGARTHSNGINRKRIWWKSPRKVYVKKSPNKHKEGEVFRHLIDDDSIDTAKVKPEKGEKLDTYYIYDLFYATVIDDKHVVEGGRVPNPLRMKDSYSRIQLPVIGRSYSSYSEEPYSLIWNTKDIQDLYDVVNYHRELYIAASGVKGQVIDIAQKPSKMSLQEHRYHKKTGNLYIETIDKAGRKISSPYNQWKDYDDTLSPNIQYLEGILQSLDETCKETMGVSRPRMGQVVPTDQVGTSEMATNQSALITEILYYESDQIEAMALRRALNLMAKNVWKDETIMQTTKPDMTTEIVRIPANFLNESDYDIVVLNNTQQEADMQEIKQLALRHHDKNLIPFRNIIDMYNKESLVELQRSVKRWSEEAEELAQMRAENAQQAEAQAQQSLKQMENEFEAMIERDKREIEQLKMQIDQAKIENEKQNNMLQGMLKEKEIDTRKEIELLKILSNRDVEMNHLDEQTRSNQANEKLKLLQLKLQELQLQINAALGVEDDKIQKQQIASKEKIEDKKMRDKNRIKN